MPRLWNLLGRRLWSILFGHHYSLKTLELEETDTTIMTFPTRILLKLKSHLVSILSFEVSFEAPCSPFASCTCVKLPPTYRLYNINNKITLSQRRWQASGHCKRVVEHHFKK